jgi:hypothetical protein
VASFEYQQLRAPQPGRGEQLEHEPVRLIDTLDNHLHHLGRIALIAQHRPPGQARVENGTRGEITDISRDRTVTLALDGSGRTLRLAGEDVGLCDSRMRSMSTASRARRSIAPSCSPAAGIERVSLDSGGALGPSGGPPSCGRLRAGRMIVPSTRLPPSRIQSSAQCVHWASVWWAAWLSRSGGHERDRRRGHD